VLITAWAASLGAFRLGAAWTGAIKSLANRLCVMIAGGGVVTVYCVARCLSLAGAHDTSVRVRNSILDVDDNRIFRSVSIIDQVLDISFVIYHTCADSYSHFLVSCRLDRSLGTIAKSCFKGCNNNQDKKSTLQSSQPLRDLIRRRPFYSQQPKLSSDALTARLCCWPCYPTECPT
jgi:hypothetical protein